MENLTDSCLPDSWNIYGAYSGLFAMIAVLAMQLIEFLAHQRVHSSRQKHNHKHIVAHIDLNECAKPDENKQCDDIPPTVNDIQQTVCRDDICVENDNSTNEKRLNIVIDNVPKVKHNHRGKKQSQVHIAEQTKGDDIDNHEGKQSEVKTKPTEIDESKRKHNDCVTIDVIQIQQPPEPAEIFPESGHFHGAAFQDDNQQHKITTYLLELGIALHSVLIGLTLGTTTESFVALLIALCFHQFFEAITYLLELGIALHSVLIGLTLGTTTESFVALLIALCFHQFFEAIALGAQIAYLPTTSMKPLIYMVVFFSLTTPIGIAIGIGIHSGTYNPKAVSSLLVSGILESLSGGVLIYIALVNLISAEMGSNAHGFFSLSTKLKVLYFISLYLGAGAMAVIGRWA